MMRSLVPTIGFVILAAAAAIADEQRGSLKGQIVFAGKVPAVSVLKLNKDIEYCKKHKPVSEQLLVDPKTLGIRNVVIWLEPGEDGKLPALPKGDAAVLKKPVKLDNAKCRFEPHVCFLRVGQTLSITNSDDIDHSVAAFLFDNDPFNVSVGKAKAETKVMKKPEVTPASVTCPIHAWMKGWLVVKDHPFVAITDAQGRFEIKNLPAGKWTFRVWHEDVGFLDLTSGKLAFTSDGKFTIEVKPTGTNLKKLTASSKQFRSTKGD